MLVFAAAAIGSSLGAHQSPGMWQVLGGAEQDREPLSQSQSQSHQHHHYHCQQQAWKTIFGEHGERGEYMDGYSQNAMIQRCQEDYRWDTKIAPETFLSERADMMSHLYSNSNSNSNHRLWEHVGMVAFADHCVIENNEEEKTTIIHKRKPFETFMRQKESRPQDRPIFAGVVLSNWEEEQQPQQQQAEGISKTLKAFQRKGIDYVRLECNFGSSIDDIGGPTEFVDNPRFRERFGRLARAARACQTQEMVPLILLQFPWRDPGPGVSMDCFKQVVKSFARALKEAEVDPERVLFETRPPIGISAQQERGLSGSERMQLGLDIGQNMFGVIQETLGPIAGFCVAGGSTKGEFPTAMEDDTQNAVRQGMRMCAKQAWGYDLCYWEMGAKLMLQPKVGRLWRHGASGKDAARELFMVNAEDMADEIRAGIVVQ